MFSRYLVFAYSGFCGLGKCVAESIKSAKVLELVIAPKPAKFRKRNSQPSSKSLESKSVFGLTKPDHYSRYPVSASTICLPGAS